MSIKAGDRLPEATLREFYDVEGNGCSLGPNAFKVSDLVKGKKIVIFGLPGAFTPTCNMNHLPGFLLAHDDIKAKGVDAIACTAVNDVHVMAAWGKASGVPDGLQMVSDGNADLTRALGLEMDASGYGMGVRASRSSSVYVQSSTYEASTDILNIESEGALDPWKALTVRRG